MTNYEEYCAKIISGLQDILGTDYTLKREKVFKNNGTQKDGLIIQKSGESFSPVVYWMSYMRKTAALLKSLPLFTRHSLIFANLLP